MQCPGGADLRDASATPCYAIAFPSCPMPPQISSVLCLRASGLCSALAQLICAVLCLCDSELCYALASPLTSFPCLCATDPCSASAMLPNAVPPPGRSFHSHALAVPVYAFPLRIRAVPCPRRASQCFALACQRNAGLCLRRASPNRAQPWLRGSPLLHRLGQLHFAFPPRNRSVRCHCRPLHIFALASHSCAMVCLRTGSHALAMPSHIIASPVLAVAYPGFSTACHLGAMLLLCCAVRAWPRTDVPCLRVSRLLLAMPSQRIAHPRAAVAWCCAASQVHATPQLRARIAFFWSSSRSSFSISPICSQMNFPLPELRQHPRPESTP